MTLNIKMNQFVKVLAWVVLAIWTAIVVALDIQDLKQGIWRLGTAVTIVGLLYWAFSKFAWRWTIFRPWLVPLPDLSGTWGGTLKSNYPGRPEPIPMRIKVSHSFSSLVFEQETDESPSKSIATAINLDEVTSTVEIATTYLNIPNIGVRHRSDIHLGTMLLKYDEAADTLSGTYWTDRGTAGDITFQRDVT